MVAVGTLQCSCFCQLLSKLPLQTFVQVLVALLHTAGVRVNSIVQNDLCYGSYCAHYMTKLMPVTFVKLSLYTIRQKCSINNRTSSTLTPYKAHQQRQQHPAVKPTLIVRYCGGGQFKFQIQQKGHCLAGRVARFLCGNVGCHFAPSSMHPFVYQRCRHRCRSVRAEEETKLVLLSMKLRTCVIGPCRDPSFPWCTGSGQCPESHYQFRNSVEALTEFVSL